MGLSKKISTSILMLILIGLSGSPSVYAQTVTPTPIANTNELQKRVDELQKKVEDLKAQSNSLSSQISLMDNQIKLTEYRISATEQQIDELTKNIGVATKRMENLEGSLTDVSKVLINRIVATYKVGTVPPIQILFTSTDARDFFSRLNYLRLVQQHDKRLMYQTQQAKEDYANQKNIFEDEKRKIEALQTQLQEYTKQLDQQKIEKERLLAETQGSEQNYQRLLSQARAQLAGFGRFATSQGGATPLSNQTVCDDWGCYYNQRDSQWGGNPLNGTGYTLASDGCLVTSMAMVYTHYGHRGVTPQTINSNPSNFASYEPAWLRKSIVADGTSSTRVNSSIDSELSAGRPVIVGISYDGGSLADHFVVIISGSNGNYQMNDPFAPNGHNIPFTSRYSIGSIVEFEKIVF